MVCFVIVCADDCFFHVVEALNIALIDILLHVDNGRRYLFLPEVAVVVMRDFYSNRFT